MIHLKKPPTIFLNLGSILAIQLQELFLPKTLLELIHSEPDAKVFWYLNRTFIGITQNIHEIEVFPSQGEHIITVIDELGNEISRVVEIKD